MKPFTIFVTIIVIIAVALFFPQILDALRGKTLIESLQDAIGFVLHVIVVSILAYAAYAISEIVRPWLKTFQQKQRHLRRSIRGRRTTAHPAPRAAAPRVSGRDNSLLWLITQLARDQQRQQHRTNITRSSGEKIRWE